MRKKGHRKEKLCSGQLMSVWQINVHYNEGPKKCTCIYIQGTGSDYNYT